MQAIRPLFKEDSEPELHGRTVIIGLSLLDRYLAVQLTANDFLDSLEREVTPSLDLSLSEEGKALRQYVRDFLQSSLNTLPDQPPSSSSEEPTPPPVPA